MAERASEVTELKRNLAQALRDKEQLQEVKAAHYLYIHGWLFPLQHCYCLAGISSVQMSCHCIFTVETMQILIRNVN